MVFYRASFHILYGGGLNKHAHSSALASPVSGDAYDQLNGFRETSLNGFHDGNLGIRVEIKGCPPRRQAKFNALKRRKANACKERLFDRKWWARQDLNLQGFPHVVLSHARLPFRHSPQSIDGQDGFIVTSSPQNGTCFNAPPVLRSYP